MDINNPEQQVVEEPTQVEKVQTDPPVEERTVEEKPVKVDPKPVVVAPVGCEHYKDLVAQYSWNVSVALAVMKAESGCNPNAVGDTHIPPVSCGLFQVRTLAGRPSCESLKDPSTNVAYAYKLYASGGWGHWTVCRTKVSCY